MKIGDNYFIEKGSRIDPFDPNNNLRIKNDCYKYVGADGYYHFTNGLMSLNYNKANVSGYNAEGITDWIWHYITKFTPINNEVLESAGSSDKDIKYYIYQALINLGLI